MQYDNSTTGDHVTLLISRPDLPANDQCRKDFFDDLEATVDEVLADHGLDAETLQTIGGHTYTSIHADCPLCGDSLRLSEPTLDASNGASAIARCQCGWRGTATYRLIDLEDTQPTHSDSDDANNSDTVQTVMDESSSVRLHDIRPMYTPY